MFRFFSSDFISSPVHTKILYSYRLFSWRCEVKLKALLDKIYFCALNRISVYSIIYIQASRIIFGAAIFNSSMEVYIDNYHNSFLQTNKYPNKTNKKQTKSIFFKICYTSGMFCFVFVLFCCWEWHCSLLLLSNLQKITIGVISIILC